MGENTIRQIGRTVSWRILVLALACAIMVVPGRAQVITLQNNNSVAQISTGSQAGMFNWSVQGLNQLHQQWFWYRVGSAPERSIDTISPPIIVQPDLRSVSVTYANPAYNLRIDYGLTGGQFVGPGQTAVSDVSEAITINNTTASPLDFHFFQYSDFDLGGPANDTIQLGRNLHGLFNEADQSDPSAGLSETVVTPGANHGEAAFLGATLVKLNDANPDVLNDNAGPVGPGNVTWALEWDFLLAPGASTIISKDKLLNVQIIPEPGSLALIALGLIGFAVRKRPRV